MVFCRNILIHGTCKYENMGCTFEHAAQETQAQATGVTGSKTLNVHSVSFEPTSSNSVEMYHQQQHHHQVCVCTFAK